ncbi:MAG: hypothetical protein M3Y53_03795 [Thermoproteota archaeon]|nr:hypothetical protein [Thermoproteota archaeon]
MTNSNLTSKKVLIPVAIVAVAVGLTIGFITTYSANLWLINKGIKQG